MVVVVVVEDGERGAAEAAAEGGAPARRGLACLAPVAALAESALLGTDDTNLLLSEEQRALSELHESLHREQCE